MEKRDIVVIGGSAGSVPALIEVVKVLPAGLQAAILIVMHVSPNVPSLLPQILSRAGTLPAAHARDGDLMETGRIYIAPPDRHLLLESNQVLVKKGPKENRFRPSIDALFRSAAYSYGARVIGVVLSGLLDDGTSGLWAVKRMGGLSVVQEPEEALCASMPSNVLEYVEVDYTLPSAEIGRLLPRLTGEEGRLESQPLQEELKRLETEIKIAAQQNAFDMGILNLGRPAPLTCPECHGALVELTEGNLTRYRCHTGHSFTQSSLLSGVY
ncbi:chemotaxis protein CheB [Paraflavisolibacter sp. H34]|uniref:chemotaxis protein CheB n=1 Tax=Huijunlia imazamoxiresistens TaxID=3127457 RepID=UPI0030189B31